jgi:AP-1 complex subunit mu
MISAIYVLDFKGKIIISRDYRGDVAHSHIESFSQRLVYGDDFEPVFEDDGVHFCFVKHENLYLVAVTRRNVDTMMVIQLLGKVVQIFTDYFNSLDEESIRDNFVVTYELLDEMIDFGYPQITDSSVLANFITQNSHRQDRLRPDDISKMATGASGSPSHRGPGIIHSPNEVFLDVIEEVNMLVSTSGSVLNSEVVGRIHVNAKLSGIPTLQLGLNERISLRGKNSSEGKEHAFLHDCVNSSQYEQSGQISFIPPDGEFDLITYRISSNVRPIFLVEAVLDDSVRTKFEILVKVKADFRENFSANNVRILVPVPKFASSPDFRKSVGKVEYLPEDDAFVWKIRQFPGGKEYLLRARFSLPSITTEEEKMKRSPISVNFEVPYFTVSGLQVKYLKIVEPTLRYNAMPWVRYMTKGGSYQIRI